jgi:MFS family permease
MVPGTIRNTLTRDFILCFSAQFAFTSAIFILMPTLPIYLSKLGSTEVEIGILIGAFGISSLVLRPIVGRALLKIDEKTFMVAGALLSALSSIGYLFLDPFWPFFIVRIFQGIASAFFFTAAILFITNITSEASRGQSLGYFFLSFNISLALAPPCGMLLINHSSFTVLFLVCVALSLCSLFICGKLGRREVNPIDDSSMRATPLFSIKAFPPTFVYFIMHMIWGALTTFFPLYAVNHDVTNPGLFFAAYAIVVIFGRTLAGRILDLYRRERIILLCHVTFIISMTLLAYSETQSMFMLVAAISGVGHAFIFPSLVAYTLDLVGSSRGPVLGLLMGMGDLGMVLGPIIMGIVLRLTNFTTMFLCVALTALISFVYFFLSIRKGKRNIA